MKKYSNSYLYALILLFGFVMTVFKNVDLELVDDDLLRMILHFVVMLAILTIFDWYADAVNISFEYDQTRKSLISSGVIYLLRLFLDILLLVSCISSFISGDILFLLVGFFILIIIDKFLAPIIYRNILIGFPQNGLGPIYETTIGFARPVDFPPPKNTENE